jgi:hypothetical protein
VTEDDTGLRVLYLPPGDNSSSISPDITIEYDLAVLFISTRKLTQTGSIVAIHGIGAHPDHTWSKNVGTKEAPRFVNWLSDGTMLPTVVPSARIMRYGYESAWFGCDAIGLSASEVAVRLLWSLVRERKVRRGRIDVRLSHD